MSFGILFLWIWGLFMTFLATWQAIPHLESGAFMKINSGAEFLLLILTAAVTISAALVLRAIEQLSRAITSWGGR